jgi:hypothetical protein
VRHTDFHVKKRGLYVACMVDLSSHAAGPSHHVAARISKVKFGKDSKTRFGVWWMTLLKINSFIYFRDMPIICALDQ